MFNLAGYSGAFKELSQNDIGLAHSVLNRVCLDNGIPLTPTHYDRNKSLLHTAVYENVKAYAEEVLFCVPTPDIAVLTSLGNLQFQLTIHNRNQYNV